MSRVQKFRSFLNLCMSSLLEGHVNLLGMLDDESPTSTNLENDHEFIINEYYLHWYEVS